VIMMPKAIDSEKKIWPYAAIHTCGSDSAAHSGVKKAFRPSAAPGRNSARTTTAPKVRARTGITMMFTRSSPRVTPSASTTIAAVHTTARGMATDGTMSPVRETSPEA